MTGAPDLAADIIAYVTTLDAPEALGELMHLNNTFGTLTNEGLLRLPEPPNAYMLLMGCASGLAAQLQLRAPELQHACPRQSQTITLEGLLRRAAMGRPG